jgi:hypothetical protein
MHALCNLLHRSVCKPEFSNDCEEVAAPGGRGFKLIEKFTSQHSRTQLTLRRRSYVPRSLGNSFDLDQSGRKIASGCATPHAVVGRLRLPCRRRLARHRVQCSVRGFGPTVSRCAVQRRQNIGRGGIATRRPVRPSYDTGRLAEVARPVCPRLLLSRPSGKARRLSPEAPLRCDRQDSTSGHADNL